MPDIHHLFTVQASAHSVFKAITSPAGLNSWWTLQSRGEPKLGHSYQFFFGPAYDWRAEVVALSENKLIEWQMQVADDDWLPTRLVFELEEHSKKQQTTVRFQHLNWAEVNDHFRRTNFCWAIYFGKLKTCLEVLTSS